MYLFFFLTQFELRRNQNFENQHNFTTDVVEVFQSQIKIFSRFFSQSSQKRTYVNNLHEITSKSLKSFSFTKSLKILENFKYISVMICETKICE